MSDQVVIDAGLPSVEEAWLDAMGWLCAVWEDFTATLDVQVPVDFMGDIVPELWAQGATGASRVAALRATDPEAEEPSESFAMAFEAACAYALEARFLIDQGHPDPAAAWYKLSESRYWAGVVTCVVGHLKASNDAQKAFARLGARASHEAHRATREKVREWFAREGHTFKSKSAAAQRASELFSLTARTIMEDHFPKGKRGTSK